MSGLEVLLGLGITANAMWIIQNAKIAIFGKNGCKWCKKVTYILHKVAISQMITIQCNACVEIRLSSLPKTTVPIKNKS